MKATPQRLKTMTKEQLIARVLSNEEALEKVPDAIAAAVRQEREACEKIASEASLVDPVISAEWLKSSNDRDEQVAFTHAGRIAAAIRARSEASHE